MEFRCGLCQGRCDTSDEPVYPDPDFVPRISLDRQINFVISGDPLFRPDVDSTQVFTQVLVLAKRIGSIGWVFGSTNCG